MTIRGIIWAALLAFAAVISVGVSFYGVYSAIRIDLRQDTVLTCIYCGLPLLCFPVFILIRPQSRSAFVLSLMALTYLGAYSALNWRTCSELGYCQGLIPTVMMTLSTNVVLAFFSVVILQLIALLMDDRSALWQN
ncbi:MAG TPA: hypothetical protein VGI45_30025 [Terracidiphilus sp.]|jgi:hypothetical protein